MTDCKYYAFFLVISCTLCFATYKRCFWVIDVVEKENLSKVAYPVAPDGEYFLRIRVECDDKMNSEVARSLLLTGVNPVVKIDSEAFGLNHLNAQRYSILLKSSLIEMGSQESCGCLLGSNSGGSTRSNKCFCNGPIPICSRSDAISVVKAGNECCDIEKNCSSFKELCNPAWLAPLYIPPMATILHCEVVDSGTGPYINSNRFTIHLDEYQLLVNNTMHNRLGDEVHQVSSVSQEIPIGCVPIFSTICVIGSSEMSNHIIYTSSEFKKMQFWKIQFDDSVQNECASQRSQSTVQVKGVLSLTDRILLNSGAGIFEVHAGNTSMGTDVNSLKSHSLVSSGCISHMVSPTQASVPKLTVLGFGEEQDKEKVFEASPEKGMPLNFVELRDSRDQNSCQFLKALLENTGSYPCHVISGSISGVKTHSFVILVMLKTALAETFHLVQFEGPYSGGNWTALFHFPTSLGLLETDRDDWQRIESTFSANDSKVGTVSLTGLSFTAMVGYSLHIYGNVLFFSPDGGMTMYWLTSFPGNSTIMVFTFSASDGTFAFLTDNQEVWVGQAGSEKVQRLKSSLGQQILSPGPYPQNSSFVLSIFFDTASRLQKIVAEGRDDGGEIKCIIREEIPVGRIISRQLFAQKEEENLKKYNASTKSSSCLQKPSNNQNELNIEERACPFARITFKAKHDVLYTRKCFYKLEPAFQWDAGLIQKSTALHEYFTEVSKAVDADCSGVSQDRRQTMKDFLPEVIQLGRSEWYSFVFYLYLDYDYKVETNGHPWSLTHLQASLYLSDAKVLKMTSLRTELIPQRAVKYEVTLQDGGVRLPQNHPGEGLVPESLHIQIWNSGLSCSASYGSRGSLQGSYAMAVLLGCPAGRKLKFDPEASKNATGKEHFCSPVHGVPCFYFYRDFLPVFKVFDLATGQLNQFHGKYGLKIVGGGPTYESITDYTQEEQTKYNYQTASSMVALIWASKLKTLGDIPIFDSKTNGISWLCGAKSPCADIGPNFPGNAEYYFKLEFSSRIVDVDSSNCDFTMRFLIRIHGLPPGSFNPTSVIVLSCIGILVTLILTLFLLKRHDAKLWKQLKSRLCANLSGAWLRRIVRMYRNKVDPPAFQFQLEAIHQVMNTEREAWDDASIDVKGNFSKRQEYLTKNV